MNVNTLYLYNMTTRLVNVRLDRQRLERARRLRAKGITLSDLVRDAIDREYQRLVEAARNGNVEEIMNEIYRVYPDPPGMPARDYDVHNSAKARAAILRKLRKKR
ncbi:MAG: hypothetical protein HY646_20665 [Acidobacteria bacterium]|nr:hypothetical protein [Acidobacteriota bacterium]